GGELVSHHDVLGQVVARRHTETHAELGHLVAVPEEMEIAAADAAGDRPDEDLSFGGNGIAHVVDHELLVAHDGCLHEIASRNSSRGGPRGSAAGRLSRSS